MFFIRRWKTCSFGANTRTKTRRGEPPGGFFLLQHPVQQKQDAGDKPDRHSDAGCYEEDGAERFGQPCWRGLRLRRHGRLRGFCAQLGRGALGRLCRLFRIQFRPVDPYAAVFEHAEAFFDWIQDDDGVDLIRRCIYLRLIGFPLKRRVPPGSPKAALLQRIIQTWHWRADDRTELDGYPQWPIHQWIAFEKRIIQKIGFVFDLLQTHGHDAGDSIDMDPEDMVDLKGRISAVFKRRRGKVDRCPSAIQARAAGNLMIAYTTRMNMAWQIRFIGGDLAVVLADDLLPLVGWLIRNRIISTAAPLVPVQIPEKHLPVARIVRLLQTASAFFDAPPVEPSPFRRSPGMDRLLVVFFSRTVFSEDTGLTVSYLWRNSWGEYFCDTADLEKSDGHWSLLYTVADRVNRFVKDSPDRLGGYRIVDCRLAPEPGLLDAVADMIRTMDALNRADDTGSGSTDDSDSPFRTAPILDLL